jgi:hypothetical protein
MKNINLEEVIYEPQISLSEDEMAILSAIKDQELNNLEIDEILSGTKFYPEDLDATLANMVERKILVRRVEWIAYYSISPEFLSHEYNLSEIKRLTAILYQKLYSSVLSFWAKLKNDRI